MNTTSSAQPRGNVVSETIEINGTQAAVLYCALGEAISSTREVMQLKSAEPYKQALAMQLASFEGERSRLVAAFPTLTE